MKNVFFYGFVYFKLFYNKLSKKSLQQDERM